MEKLEENIGEFSYSNVFSQPLGFGVGAGPRNVLSAENEPNPTILDPNLPPAHPSVGINLPKLPKLYEPNTAETRLTSGGQSRLKYYGFSGCTEGPTDASCWVSPGLIAMGSIPFGAARKNSSLDSVSGVMLAGVGTFVSLLGGEEEKEIEVVYAILS